MENSIEDYAIKEQIGKGGFASVYRAVSKHNGLEVAVKIIDKRLMQAAGMCARVRQEVQIHSTLQHTAILQLYTFFEDEHCVYLVLELCRNGELAKHVRTCGVLSEQQARRFMQQIVDGLVYLNGRSILHRDLSLSNLLLDDQYQVKIADFGLATQLQSPTDRHRTMCGTPNYISPEVATRSWHGPAADVWALGCMLYTMLVGRPPFDTDAVRSTLTRVVITPVHIPVQLSTAAADLIRRLLHKDPAGRLPLASVRQHRFMREGDVMVTPVSGDGWSTGDSGLGATLNTLATVSSAPSSCLPVTRRLADRPPADTRARSRRTCSVDRGTPPAVKRQGSSGGQSGGSTERHSDGQFDTAAAPAALHSVHSHSSQLLHGLQRPRAAAALQLSDTAESGDVCGAPPVSPLSTRRLKATRQRLSRAVFSVDSGGHVFIEFVREGRAGSPPTVVNVWQISADGNRVVIYRPRGGEAPLTDSAPPVPTSGADTLFSYHTLPRKYWKKYSYAARFVKMVRAKTAKITLYTAQAKCILMENCPDPDLEVNFYHGGSVTRCSGCVTVCLAASDAVSGASNTFVLKNSDDPRHLSAAALPLWQHYLQCLRQCEMIDSALSSLEETIRCDDNVSSCFPVIIGRRPAQQSACELTLDGDKENVQPPPASAVQSRSAPSPLALQARSGQMLTSGVSVTSGVHSLLSSQSVQPSSQPHGVRVQDIGIASQLADGSVRLVCDDGCLVRIDPASGRVESRRSAGAMAHVYTKCDALPSRLKHIMRRLPDIVEALVRTGSSFRQ